MAKEKNDKKKGMTAEAIAKKFNVPETIVVKIGDTTIAAELREFSTGSKGYYMTGKVIVGDKAVKCQVSGSIVIVGSKEE